MSRLLAYGFGLGVVALAASPGLRDPGEDGYPLSTYPMFGRARDKPWLNFVEGADAQGAPRRLSPALVAHDEVMQVAATVRRAVEAGPAAVGPLCASVAARIAASAEARDVTEVRVVRAQFDPVRYFVEGPAPEAREVVWACPVARQP
ncbi:MAG: hypothetical protein ABW252_07435 [Polyangiales bacterium]